METLRRFEKVCEIVDQNGRNPARLIPILQAVQSEYRYLPEEILTFIATSLGISPAKVFGVATFYSLFTLKPKGKYIVRVCDGTACHVKGSMNLHAAIREKLRLPAGKETTSDMLFTLETVNCLGACGLAPAMVVNEEVFGQLTPERAASIIDDIIRKEAWHESDDDRAKKIDQKFRGLARGLSHRVVVCAGTGCLVNGSMKVYEEFIRCAESSGLDVVVELKKEEKGVFVSKSGCQGFCQIGPLVTVLPEGLFYTRVTPDDVKEIVDATLKKGEPVERLLYREPQTGRVCGTTEEIPFYRKQKRFVLEKCGKIDPENIAEYISEGGYLAATRACIDMKPEDICDLVMDSGLRGRGGGGFLTGKKWHAARIEEGPKKYVICNGDEGDPGAFMDMGIMEGNPHSVIEGMIIAAQAIGADEGYVYVRAEYPLAVKRLRKAIEDATALGVLGKNLLGSEHTFYVRIMEGAGAFVCGEETALIASIEGKRGMPLPKPPFPAQSGLWRKPTVINNVETLSTIPLILSAGADAFRALGTKDSPGTKTFALTGHVVNTGLIEMPLGSTLREVVYQVAGGITTDDGKPGWDGFKAAQIGGPSGGCLTKEHLDLPIDFDSVKKAGAMVGSGGLVVMNNDTCMVAVARFFMQFTQSESCGKCVPCREGTKQMLALLDDIIEGRATEETLDLLEELARLVQKGSLCGLGKSAPNPVLSTLRHFRDEYVAHVKQRHCPTGKCKALAALRVDPELCRGCTACGRKCPVNAISGEKGKAHFIDPTVCTKCGTCITTCKFNAIMGAAS